MKEASPLRRRTSPSVQNIKLLCSFNGVFQRRPPTGKLRYIGGETRMVSVDRNIGILKFRSKISEICPNNHSFSLRYQLPDSENVYGDSSLVSIVTDDDLRCMIDEYDTFESNGKHSRLWVFVCNDNGYVGVKTDTSLTGFCSEKLGCSNAVTGFLSKDLNVVGDLGDLCFNGITTKTNVAEVQNSGNFFSINSLEPQIPVTHIAGNQNHGGFFMFKPIEPETPSIRFAGTQDSDSLLGEVAYEPPPPVPTNPTTSTLGDGNIYIKNSSIVVGGNLRVESNASLGFLSNRFGQGLANGVGYNTGSLNQSVGTVQFPKQVHYSTVASISPGLRKIEHAYLGNLNRENVVPWTAHGDHPVRTCLSPISCCNQLVGRVSPLKPSITNNRLVGGNLQCEIRSHGHRFGSGHIRNQKISPCYMRNHLNNPTEMGNHHVIGLDRKPSPWKCYPGVKPSSNISKHGHAVRSNYSHYGKSPAGAHEHRWAGIARVIESSKDNRPSYSLKNTRGALRHNIGQPISGRCSVDNVSRERALIVTDLLNQNSQGNNFGYHRVCHGTGYQYLLPGDVIESQISCFKAMTTSEDLLSDLNHAKHKVPLQATCNDFHGTPDVGSHTFLNIKANFQDLKKELPLVEPQKDAETSKFSIHPGYSNGTKLEYNSRCCLSNMKVQPDLKSCVTALRNVDNDIDILFRSGIASSVDPSLYKLPLSSSKEVEPPTLSSSLATSDVLESLPSCELAPQQCSLDLMDEGHFSSGKHTEKSKGLTTSSTFENATELGKEPAHIEDNKHDTPSPLSVDDKDEVKGSHNSSKVIGGICKKDLAAFYTRLATRELQTIKNSDLEDIKKIGSGTYGTVFYGKWRGSDVAIKRIKPSCFTGGELEDDRLIVDFWKEAHMLGELHHPNVVAFYGVVTDGPATNLATVTEYMVNGSLKQVLQRKDRTIDRRKRLIIAMDAAFGMEYLHEKNIVHFDLKSHNFLVNMRDPQRPVCKIGDLGLSKVKQKTLVSGGVRGTIPWMAPELLTNKNNMVTEKVDVYSFGIVMWELLTGEEPFPDLRSEEIIAGIIKGDLRPEVPRWCEPSWRSLMERCWSSDPELRPSFMEIAKELRTMSAALNIK